MSAPTQTPLLTSPHLIASQSRVPTAPPIDGSYYRAPGGSISDDKDVTASPQFAHGMAGKGKYNNDYVSPNDGIHNRKHLSSTAATTTATTATTAAAATPIQPMDANTSVAGIPIEEDLYARDKARSKFKFYYYRYVNPWIRWLIALPLLYIYALFSGILTYRHNTFRDYLVGIVSPVTDPVTLPDGTKPFVLRDLMHDLFPAQQGATLDHWISFADATPIIWIVICVLMLLIRRDMIRITEFIVIELILFTLNAVAHVLTTYPDAHGYQYSCIRPEMQNWGNWVFHTITTSYCGDMMWSGHTQNTLVPLIMMRRMLFDFLGWNISWGVRDAIAQRFHQPQLQSGYYNSDIDRNNHFMDYVSNTNNPKVNAKHKSILNNMASSSSTSTTTAVTPTNRSLAHANTQHRGILNRTNLEHQDYPVDGLNGAKTQMAAENDAFQYRSSEATRIAQQNIQPQYEYTREKAFFPVSAADTAPNTGNIMAENKAVEDETALASHEHHDVHINVHAATTVPAYMPENHDHDIFFFKQISPYTSPPLVQQHRRLFFVFQLVLRIIFACWFIALIITLMLIRYHYSTDVYISMLMCSLVATNTHLIQTLVRCLYRPYYHNYLYNSWWRPVYLRWPLNEEQVNYEERMRRVAVGGLF